MRRFFLLAMTMAAPAALFAGSAERALALYKDGKYAEAAQQFESALTGDLTHAQRRIAYLYMGKSYESAGRLDKAISAYEEAAEYDRSNWRRHRDLAGLYEQAELYSKALASYQTAFRLNKTEPSFDLAFGRTWRKIGVYSYAVPYLEKARDAGIEPIAVQQQLSLAYEGQGRYAAAASASLKAADDPKRVVYLAVLAGDRNLADEGLRRMKERGLPKDTLQAYENLVQLGSLPPKQILAGKIGRSTLQELLEKP